MSFSFSIKAANKNAAKDQVVAEMAKVIASQPSHAADAPLVINTAHAYIDMLPNDADKDVVVNLNGSIGWKYDAPVRDTLSSASVGVSAYLNHRETPQ